MVEEAGLDQIDEKISAMLQAQLKRRVLVRLQD